jgi:hypothetical protein
MPWTKREELHALLSERQKNALMTSITPFIRASLEYIIKQVKTTKPGIETFIHGYDYAIPDGRAVIRAHSDGTSSGHGCCQPWNANG